MLLSSSAMASTRCEVCTRGEQTDSPLATRHILIETRLLYVCEAHARWIRSLGINNLAGLGTLLREPSGRRSQLDRRAILDRRTFPARPEGRRGGRGRRSSDP
jgi:hypothetical protein